MCVKCRLGIVDSFRYLELAFFDFVVPHPPKRVLDGAPLVERALCSPVDISRWRGSPRHGTDMEGPSRASGQQGARTRDHDGVSWMIYPAKREVH